MTNANLSRRLERLESVGDGSNTVVVMHQFEGETADDAEARWYREHPGDLIPPAALRVVLRRFSPLADQEAGHAT